ncbi:MAG TPA: transposase [Candidatus Saccharimonadales bacterium]|nr:transposase [Candidatus Saccharimonadales bacterium]
MPSRNSLKEYIPEAHYHVYNRGVEKRVIFLDDQDYIVFLGLLKKYLTGENGNKGNRHKFDNLGNELELLAYCLMPNHFHLLFYQVSEDAITKLMRRVITGYAMYFNSRYGRVGGLFQGRYKASQITADAYLHHISRYIHLNPADYKKWPYSSYSSYTGSKSTQWLKPGRILDIFNNNRDEYISFLDEYVDTKHELDVLKYQLANDIDEL